MTFTSVVRNAGSAPTPAGVAIGLAYLLDGAYTTWGSVGGPWAPGASVTITTQGGSWTAVAGTYELIALADDVNRFEESNEQNNATSASFTVGASPSGTSRRRGGLGRGGAGPAFAGTTGDLHVGGA